MPIAKTWQAWTTREQLRMEELHEQGYTAAGIALELGTHTVAAVRNRMTGCGLRRPRRIGRYLPHVTRPHRLRHVAQALGVSVIAVKHAKQQLRAAGFEVLPAPKGRYQ